MSQFDELLAQLNAEQEEQSTLAKALPAGDGEDDQTIQTASEDGAEGKDNPEDTTGDEDENGDVEPMAKSMTVDGEEVEIVDVGELIKSLQGLTGRVDEHESVLAKGLSTALDLMKGQGEMIKSLTTRVEQLAGQGRGRKTVLAITERPAVGEQTLAKSEQALQPGEILAKALAAQASGAISGHDVARCETAINTGSAIPAEILSRI